ncbi:torsin-4A [Ambystoma mexicanum]|uniref:torsin-4A n=1 Tax=Ambystoma mexicanum TaxID=8296 RepID=UPI0037E7DF3D
MEEIQPCAEAPELATKMSMASCPIRAMIRLRRRVRNLKKSRLHLDLSGGRALETIQSRIFQKQLSFEKTHFNSGFQNAPYFSFDTPNLEKVTLIKPKRKKKRRTNRVVMYPGGSRKYLPVEHKSKAKRCLILLVGIICFQILNAIENLDDNLQKYDLDGLEKTMHRDIFGQQLAVDSIMHLLKDYLATHIHNKPLVVSLNGPSGVGKSHMGRLLAKHFRSVMDNDFVLQYYAVHHCPQGNDVLACQRDLSGMVSDVVVRAEIEEKIPVLIFDEMEEMPPLLLDLLREYFQPNQSNEFLNAIYILISNIGGSGITKYVLQNASSDVLSQHKKLRELSGVVKSSLQQHHMLWDQAEVVPFILLEKSHIINCFLDEMLREGYYPDNGNIESLASQLKYYTQGERHYSIMGCKQVVAKVNLLH